SSHIPATSTLSLHDALPISYCDILPGRGFEQAASLLGENYDGWLTHDGWAVYYKFLRAGHQSCMAHLLRRCRDMAAVASASASRDRKSTRLNSSHVSISYAV